MDAAEKAKELVEKFMPMVSYRKSEEGVEFTTFHVGISVQKC